MLPRAVPRTGVILRHIRAAARMSTDSSSQDEVFFQEIRGKGVITLNRPKALNAFNLTMIRKIQPQMQSWENDSGIGLVIIKGAGEKAFCAGGDVRAIYEAGKAGDRLTQDFFREEYTINYKIGTYKKPYIAIIDGVTMGGGVGLSVHGKFRVATERSLFAMPETAIGLFPDVGGGHFLPRLRGQLGVYLALTGFRLKGRDVQAAGIATHFVHTSKVEELESRLLDLSTMTDSDVMQVLDTFHQTSTSGESHEFSLQPHMDQIDRLFRGRTLEEIYNSLESDGSEWALKQLNTLHKMSPTSMKVSLRQLQKGANLNLKDCLQMEYRLSQHCMQDHDFFEGVRAVLVDKDNSPKWNPATIQQVTDEKVDWYFSELSPDLELKL